MIDAIFSGGGNALCCAAVQHGFGYGINSAKHTLCLYAEPTYRPMSGHDVLFIDNNYKHYDHARHLEVVRRHKPKYATVFDVMSPGDLPQILDWAAEVNEFAEHVIIIPKCDCVDQIPGQYMLGYAVPTSYGGTNLPYSAFGNRPVHLLGGAWAQQRDILLNSGMNVASLDFNHCHKLACTGVFNDPRGFEFRFSQAMPGFSKNPLMTCMALSLAAIRSELLRIESAS